MTAPAVAAGGVGSWRDRLPPVRGRLIPDAPLAPYTWLRVGGPAGILYLPADADDLAGFLAALDPGVPVTALGVGSNTLVRDGGVEGVVVRLATRPFAAVEPVGSTRLRAGAGALDVAVARAAAKAGLAGLEFLTGVPGTVGGACTMNAGCYGAETKDVLVEAHALDRQGRRLVLANADMGFAYRHCDAAEGGLIFTTAVFEGQPDSPEAVSARMAAITERREAAQPIREKTGGSTFRNPPGRSAWQVVDELGWRGKPIGDAMFSPKHANFLINRGNASAADLETLGKRVASEAWTRLGIELEWEVKRIGYGADDMYKAIRRIDAPDGARYVEILGHRRDQLFSFKERERQVDLGYEFWAGSAIGGIYDSATTAEAEARRQLPWLKEFSED